MSAAAVSARDSRVRRAAALLRAPAGGLVALDGPELIAQALSEGLAVEEVIAGEPRAWGHAGAPVVPAAPDALRALGALGQPAEVVAVVRLPEPPAAVAPGALVLAGVRDAGNVGSICRTAAALSDVPLHHATKGHAHRPRSVARATGGPTTAGAATTGGARPCDVPFHHAPKRSTDAGKAASAGAAETTRTEAAETGRAGAAVAVTGATADPFSRKALRAGMGAQLRPGLVARIDDLAVAPSPLAAAVARGGLHPRELPPRTTIVLGNERDGLGAHELARCDLRVTIPAPGFESLNVAAAAAILLWELRSGA